MKSDSGAKKKVRGRDQRAGLSSIQNKMASDSAMDGPASLAEHLRDLYSEIEPLIEQYTSAVCPQCREVCCRQRFAFPDEKDLLFLKILGAGIPTCDVSRPDDGPCQFLGKKGCVKPRWLRPLRCTWFFCEPLLKAMGEGTPKTFRKLTAVLGEIVRISSELQSAYLRSDINHILSHQTSGIMKHEDQ
ncbi:MAG TPA: hypothetical protein VFG09_13905 [Thermodesulfovibrionales bacterium]|jgi:hypothetical protein|nr:hypothetical protein [Thermodesulfovibrionales bacterium]